MTAPKEAKQPTDRKRPMRKKSRKVHYVTFTLPDWDEPFTLPDLNRMTQKQQWAVGSGDRARLSAPDVLGPEYTEVVEEMEDDEVEEFMAAWKEASEVEPGESSAV